MDNIIRYTNKNNILGLNMNIKKIISEEVATMLEASITRAFRKAAEGLHKVQLQQQQLRKAFVAEKDPKKKEQLKQALIKLHTIVQTAEMEFNQVLRSEPAGELQELEAEDDTEFTVNIKHLLKKHVTKGGEIKENFKKGDKVKYLGNPGIITNVKDYNGKTYYSVSYNKGTGKTKASNILSTDGTVTEATFTPSSGTMSGGTYGLDSRKYQLKKDVKGARIGNFTNVTLPKGTIIYNLPGGIFADHFSLKNKYSSRSSQGPRYFDQPKFKGIMITSMPGTIKDIEKNSKVLESVNEAKDNLYLQLHKKYADQIKGLKAKKIKKLTDLVSVQRWAMEDEYDNSGFDRKAMSKQFNDERKLFKQYMAGDKTVSLKELDVRKVHGDKRIENPKTGNKVKLRTALKGKKGSKVYQTAKKIYNRLKDGE